jgi:hypothetical protein
VTHLVLWLVLTQEAPFAEATGLPFRHRSGSAEKTYILETMGSGVALFDYDSDSDLDVYFVNAGTVTPFTGAANRLFRNEGAFRFVDVTEQSGLGDEGFGMGVAVADVDNDSDLDVYVTNYGPNALYRNAGDGTFTRSVAGVEDERWSSSAAFADVDSDGFVDLYVANYLHFDRELLDRLVPERFCEWKGLRVNCGPRGFAFVSGALFRNRGDGAFEDVTLAAGLEREDAYQLGAVFSDLDSDGDQDLYVATDSTPNLLFENRGDGTFADRSLLSGASFSYAGAAQAGMGVDAGDFDSDGSIDLVVTNFSDDYNTLYRNRGSLTFVDSTDVAGLAVASLPYLGWSVFLEDLDSDQDLDLFVVNGHVYPQVDGAAGVERFRQPLQLFWNDGAARYVESSSALLREPRVGRGAAIGDLDSDADPDVVISILDGEPLLLEYRGEGYVSVNLVGRTSNRDGIGAKVLADSEGRKLSREARAARGYLSSSEPAVRLAPAQKVVIEWPSGIVDEIGPLSRGSFVVLEGRGIVYRRE